MLSTDIKKKIQQQHLDQMKDPNIDKSQIILHNSGFAAAIHKYRHKIKIIFGQQHENNGNINRMDQNRTSSKKTSTVND